MEENSLSNRFLKILNDNNLNYRSMAEKCGLDESRIRKVIKKEIKNPNFKVLSAILKAFPNVSPDWLMLGEGPYKRNDESYAAKKSHYLVNESYKCPDCYMKDGIISRLEVFNESLTRKNEQMNQEIGRLKEKLEDYERGNNNHRKNTG